MSELPVLWSSPHKGSSLLIKNSSEQIVLNPTKLGT